MPARRQRSQGACSSALGVPESEARPGLWSSYHSYGILESFQILISIPLFAQGKGTSMPRNRLSPLPLLLMLWIALAFSVALPAQTFTFLNAQGQPLGEPYLEGSRAYLQVIDPGAAVSVSVDVSVTRSGDFEVLVLAETGVGTGVFEGSVELSNAVPVGNGRLETSRDVSQYPWRFDVLTATYGAAGDTATTVGSTVATLDAGGNPATSYVVGDRIYLRVTDAFANATAGVDTTVVNLSATVGTWGEYETVLLTETGGNTSTFTGSILTAPGSDPVQQDGSLEIQPGSAIWVQHNDANGQTYSAVQLAALSNLPVTLQLTDPSGQPVSSYQEFQPAVIRATDGPLAGAGSVTARVTSALRGDEEYVLLYENGFFSATFVGTVALGGTLSTAPAVANDGLLEVTEIAGPPLQRDTIHVELLGCSAAPCPTDSADMAGTSLRLTNAQGIDVGLVAPPASIVVEARDYSVPSWSPTSATVTSGDDTETVALTPAAEYEIGLFRGTVSVEIGPAVPGDGDLQVAASDVVTASRPDPLGLSSATDTAVVGSGLVSFLDSTGAPVDYVLTDGDIRISAFNPEGNLDPGAADSITVTVVSRDNTGAPRDTETLLLVETGTDTSSFTGQMPSRWYGYVMPFDGELQTAMTGLQLDTVDATLGSTTATATMKVGIVRFVDASGADVGNVPPGGTIRLQVEAPTSNYDPLGPDLASIRLRSMTSGDDETFSLLETGPDTSIFETSLGSVIAAAVPYNQVFETQLGETLQAEYYNYYHVAADIAVVGEGEPTNNPPLAVNDEATTGNGTPVVVDVLANDSDPEGQTFTVASFTQGTQGGTVTSNYAGFLTYTPPPSFLGTDTFTYRLVDLLGAEAFATVTITVVNQPPVAADDYLTLNEDQDVLLTPTDNDSDPGANALTIVAVTQGTLGAVSIYNQTLGYVRYTAQPNVSGSDAFTYTVANPQGATATATVYVTIQPVNDPPVAVNDTVTTAEDTLVNVQVRANDSDPDGDPITFATAS